MIFKSYELEKKIELINNYKISLFYGENHGLKKEFKEKISNINKNCEIIRLFQDELLKNNDILSNEIFSQSLFNRKKIIFVEESSDKIIDLIHNIEEKISDERVFIFSEILDKRSKLRSHFEKSKECLIVPCYNDSEITIKRIISDRLKGYKPLTNEILNLIFAHTGIDRSKVDNEINKIQNCFADEKINISQIEELLNIRTNDDFNILKDEAICGNKKKTNRLLADTVFESDKSIYYLNSINQRINKLNDIEKLKNEKKGNLEDLITSLKPPVFWKEKAKLIDQSKKWNKEKLQIALRKTYSIELRIKSNSSIDKNILMKNLIIELCNTASSS